MRNSLQPALFLWLWSVRGRSRRLNVYPFDIENKCGVRGNDVARPALPIGQIGGNEYLPFGTYRHELQHFLEPRDHIFHFKGHGLPCASRAVKLRAVNKCSLVVAQDRIGFRWLLSRASGHNLVLQSVREGDDSYLL